MSLEEERKSHINSGSGDFVPMDDADSFDDDIKPIEPIDMEPVFSTAAGVRIEVSAESLERTKQLFQTDLKQTKQFSSPIVRGGALMNGHGNNKGFISPFRSVEMNSKPTTSIASNVLKRPAFTDIKKEEEAALPIKKAFITQDSIEITGKIVRIECFPEVAEKRVILQVEPTSSKILVRFDKGNVEKCEKISIFSRIRIKNSRVVRKNTNMEIEEMIVNDFEMIPTPSVMKNGEEHSFAAKPFIREPSFIHELESTGTGDEDVQIAVLKVNIVDFGPKLYHGCSNCKYRFNKKNKLPDSCPKCREKAEDTKCIFSLMRVVDFSGQLQIYVPHEIMEGFLKSLGYQEIREMDKFCNLQEQMSYIFKPIMVRLQRKNPGMDGWVALEFAEVDWEGYCEAIERKLCDMEEEKTVRPLKSSEITDAPMNENEEGIPKTCGI